VESVERKSIYESLFGNVAFWKKFKAVSGHVTIPILIGSAVTATGHSYMLVRSAAIIVCAVWLSLDIGVWTSETAWSQGRKAIVFCLATCILCCMGMGIMYWFLFSTLEDQRADVYQHLEIGHTTPSGHSDDPMFEIFSVTNRGSFDISKKHGITCLVNMAIGNRGTSRDSGMWLTSHGTRVSMGGNRSPDRTPATSILKGSGDTESEACLRFFGNSFVQGGSDCIDTTLSFWYSLETQEDVDQEKRYRFVAFRGPDGKFSWASESIDSKEDYCGSYFKPLS